MSEQPVQDAIPDPRVSVPVPKVSEPRDTARDPLTAPVDDVPGYLPVPRAPGPPPRGLGRAAVFSGVAALLLPTIGLRTPLVLLAPFASITAIVLGAVSRRQSRRFTGRGGAAGAAGILLGLIGLVVFVLILVAVVILLKSTEQEGVWRYLRPPGAVPA